MQQQDGFFLQSQVGRCAPLIQLFPFAFLYEPADRLRRFDIVPPLKRQFIHTGDLARQAVAKARRIPRPHRS